jgi:ketosteroid isomerase-like protein
VSEDAEIVALEEQLRLAMLAGDVFVLNRLIDDDLAFVTYTGGIADKAMDLAAHASRTLQLTAMTPSDRRIRRYGDIATVSVRMAVVGSYAGVPFDTAFRYLRVWRRTDDAWRIITGGMVSVQE